MSGTVIMSQIATDRWTPAAGEAHSELTADGIWYYYPPPDKATHDIHLFAAAFGTSRVTVQAEHRGGFVQSIASAVAASGSWSAEGYPWRFIFTMATYENTVSARVESWNSGDVAHATAMA